MKKPTFQNPFKPGEGRFPPYFAGRTELLRDLLVDADRLSYEPDPSPGGRILLAPRGYGKAALLTRFLEAARDRLPDGTCITRINGARIGSKLELVAATCEIGDGIYELSERALISPSRMVSLEIRKGPRVLIVDNAGELDIASACILLNAAEGAGSRAKPAMVVFSGTPKTRRTFSDTGASFWDRFNMTNLPLLTDQESSDAIAKPIMGAGMRIAPDALGRIVESAQGHPHVLQTWGRAVYDVACQANASDIDMSIVRRGRAAVQRETDRLCEARLRKLGADDDLLIGAAAVARDFTDSGESARASNQIYGAVSAALEARSSSAFAPEVVQRLHSPHGFVWRVWEDGQMVWEPTLPSLMSHTLERHGHLAQSNPVGVER